MVFLIKQKELVTVKINYYIPDYQNILNEFFWQTEDLWPEIPRVHKFLNFWKDNIAATIKIIEVMNCKNSTWRTIDDLRNFK